MKHITFIITILFLQPAFSQSVKVKYYNKTGYDIDSVVIEKFHINTLKKDSSTNFLSVSCLLFQDGRPYNDAPGKIQGLGTKFCISCQCGTGVTPITSGVFEYDIKLIKNEEKHYSLVLRNHIK